ncbi:MAG: DUF1573 domain-containing protein [Verrucomicrobia bacterium]|nr:DUF1573 domain-containing protein [Verrucomicrobiota bacterium]
MRIRLKSSTLAALVVLALSVATGKGQPVSDSSTGKDSKTLSPQLGPRLQILKPVHDFGTVKQGQIVRHDFKLMNIGDQPLEITEVKPSCGCTTAADWTRTIQPGGSGTIPLQLETARFAGSVAKTITVTSNDRTEPQRVLEIKADIWTPVQLSSPVVVFPALTNSAQIVSRPVTIRNQVDAPVEITELKSDSLAFKPELKEIVAGKEFELMISTVPPLTNGTHSARISMKTSNPQMPALSVTAVATVLPAVQIAPTQIMLPAAKLTAAEKRYVVILNHRAADLKVSDLKLNVDGVDISTNTNPGSRQFTVILTFPAGFQARESEKMVFRGSKSIVAWRCSPGLD